MRFSHLTASSIRCMRRFAKAKTKRTLRRLANTTTIDNRVMPMAAPQLPWVYNNTV